MLKRKQQIRSQQVVMGKPCKVRRLFLLVGHYQEHYRSTDSKLYQFVYEALMPYGSLCMFWFFSPFRLLLRTFGHFFDVVLRLIYDHTLDIFRHLSYIFDAISKIFQNILLTFWRFMIITIWQIHIFLYLSTSLWYFFAACRHFAIFLTFSWCFLTFHWHSLRCSWRSLYI